jgi:hypothetical protein
MIREQIASDTMLVVKMPFRDPNWYAALSGRMNVSLWAELTEMVIYSSTHDVFAS